MVCALLCALSLFLQGSTFVPETNGLRVVGVDLCEQNAPKDIDPTEILGIELPAVLDSGFYLLDTLDVTVYLPQGSRAVFAAENEQLETVYVPQIELTELAWEAIELAPIWLQDELIDNFSRLDTTYQNIYADLIINPTDSRYRDEIAFTVAHVSPEILMDSVFSPELLVVNAQYLYQNDDSLQYVDIVDYDNGGGDYYSTVRYWVVEINGDTVQKVLNPYYYYYYIVHPQLSDESPRMDSYVYNKFWREYLFYEADSGYPVLCEKLKYAKVVWCVTDTPQVYPGGREFDSTQTALDIIGNWATRTVPEPASGNRPIQPNVIAHEHNGNCGELQDLLAAASRAALIPVTSVFTLAEDHVWNEFYDDGWHEYQVDLGFGSTHINDPRTAYDVDLGGSKQVSSVMEWRSDGLVRTVTNHYSNTCSLTVVVRDQWGLPIDGARIILYTEGWYGGYDVTTWGFTDENGICKFELGNLRNFYVHINTPLGDYPSDPNTIIRIISQSQTGAHYFKSFTIPEFMPIPRASLALTGNEMPAYKLDITVEFKKEFLHGYARARRNTGDAGFYHTYCERIDQMGCVDIYVVDSLNYERYEAGEPFDAIFIARKVNENSQFEVLLPPTSTGWFVVVSGESNMTTSVKAKVIIRLYGVAYDVAEGEEVGKTDFAVSPTVSGGRFELTYSIPRREKVSICLHDVTGRVVDVLLDGVRDAGNYTMPVDLDLPSGIYFLTLSTSDVKRTQRVLILR